MLSRTTQRLSIVPLSKFRMLGRLKIIRMIADKTILNEEVETAPKTGNIPFARAAPH